MSWLDLRTEFSFGAVYGPIDYTIEILKKQGATFAGIADIDGTWGHVPWEKACTKAGIKPIFGVRLAVVADRFAKERRGAFNMVTLIAMNNNGLRELYRYVELAYNNFYYFPRLGYEQLNAASENITILSGVAPNLHQYEREVFLQLSPNLPLACRHYKLRAVAGCDNWYPKKGDKKIYEPFADNLKMERKTTPMHILSDKDWLQIFPGRKDALKLRNTIAKAATVTLAKAPLVKYDEKFSLKKICKKGAKERGVDLKDPVYKERFKKELKLIKKKNYSDYFMVVADAVNYAKSIMLVGPSRGSSAGSLVCYLMGITEVDPIPFNLVFERFIDINREDLPDIDIDFQDDKRIFVFKYLEKKYGRENVAQLGNVNRLKPKSAIARFSKAFDLPLDDVEEVKDAIVERSSGDARANLCMEDTFNESDIGQAFIKRHPSMRLVSRIENHASHTGIHAAGALVCNEPITKYASLNTRDRKRIAMIDKKDAEYLGLLKIDALGLRTLSILAEVCDQIRKPYSWLYTIPLDDKRPYKLLNKQRMAGIFQFEGNAVRNLAKQMPIETIEDISALGALARPGPLATGGAAKFVARRSGKEPVEYMANSPYVIDQIKESFGIIIYQEQVMNIGYHYGGLSWEDVSELRKAMSKSYGDEFFGKYKEKFIKGAIKKGAPIEEAEAVWKNMNSMGSWSFNKSHAVSYGIITYLCAYLKCYYPLEFTVASLNHERTPHTARKFLRDMVENEKIKYVPIDPELSQPKWSVTKKVLYGGFMTIEGIGPKSAASILDARANGKRLPPGIIKKLKEGDTPFKYLYPAKEIYGEYYKHPEKYLEKGHRFIEIDKMKKKQKYCFIGCLVKRVVRDSNEAILISRRGGVVHDGPTTYMNLTIEDDTEQILCTIGRYEYDDLGKDIAESGKVDKDWYMVEGGYDPAWHKVYVHNIKRITCPT